MANMWETCPKCKGEGNLNKPTWINHNNVVMANIVVTCDVCNGGKIISSLTGYPQGKFIKKENEKP